MLLCTISPQWSEEVDQRISQQCFKYLVATKADVIARNPTSCVVSSDEGQQLAASLGPSYNYGVAFFELFDYIYNKTHCG